MSAMMQAARFHAPKSPLSLETMPIPEIKAHETLIEVRACGLCGTDLHIAREGTIPTAKVPITLGHEVAGVITQTGSDVQDWRVGDRVAVYPHEPCGACSVCRSGHEALCPNTRILGLHIDGGFAQFLKIRADCLFRLPSCIPFEQGAIITDAVSTAFHAVTQRGRLEKGERVAIFGCGGVGHQAIKIARFLEAQKILAVDVAEGALRRAQEAGADELIDARPGEPSRKIKERTGGEGVDLAIECVGLKSTVAEAMKSLKRGGRLVILGVGNERVELPPLRVFVGTECCVMGSMGFSRQDARTVIALVADGKLDLSSSVTAAWPLAQINEAIDQLEKRHGDPVRIVILPQEQKRT